MDPARLEAKGYADTQPLAPNDTDLNRLRNRRIEIEISW
jgi:chemotaxis protein MotB